MATQEVILKEKIEGLGAEADVVKVRRGYARNFLLTQGKAFEATKGNLRNLQHLKEVRAKREAEELIDAEKVAAKIKKAKLTFELSTGQGGKAFGSVTSMDILQKLEEKKINIHKKQIDLPRPIKSTGSLEVPIKVHPDIVVDLRVQVKAAAEEGQEERAEKKEASPASAPAE